MVATPLEELYKKYAPKWFKVIRWRDIGRRQLIAQEYGLILIYVPAFVYLIQEDHYPTWLWIKKPQTDEERLALKRDLYTLNTQRDWKIDQYSHEQPPRFDVWRRRQKYPEYYGEKYNGFYRDAYAPDNI